MKGEIILGLGTIGVAFSTLSMVACGNTNKLEKDNIDSDTTKSTKEINKYPELTESLVFSYHGALVNFVKNKGNINYFDKYLSHYEKESWNEGSKTISNDKEWFIDNFGTRGGLNNTGNIVINYHEFYDWLHKQNPTLHPYLND